MSPTEERLAKRAGIFLRLVLQIGLVLGIYYLGLGLAYLVPVGIPGNLLGMLLLLALLLSGVLKPAFVNEACSFLLKYMSIFFLPAAVSLMGAQDVLNGVLVKFFLVCLVTTILVFAATAGTVVAVSSICRRHRAKGGV